MRLPNEYQEVEYIQSERTQKINTGINADYKLSIDAEIAILGDGAMGVIKYLGSSQYTRHHFNNSNNRTAYYYRGVSATLQEPYDTDRHHYNIDIYNKEIQFDNGEKRIITYENFDAELNYWLFARNSNVDNLKYNLPMKLYSFKMYYAGTPVRDFVPCFRKSDSEIGLYDLINGVFYTNEGTGTFTKGDSVYYTADKLSYLRETKSLLKDKINDLTGEITDESTFAEYAEAIENLYDELPKVSGDGTEVTLANVKAGKMKAQPLGNTIQYSTTGKNILSDNYTDYTTDGLYGYKKLIDNLNNNYLVLSIIDKDTTVDISGIFFGFTETGVSNTKWLVENGNYSSNYTSTNILKYFSYYPNNQETFNKIFSRFNIQCEVVSSGTAIPTPTSYEPYTGGIPSPNPNYPQEIKNVAGDNNVIIRGKNILSETSGNISISNYYYSDVDANITITDKMIGKKLSFSFDINITTLTNSPSLSVTIGYGVYNNMTNNIKSVSYDNSDIGKHSIKLENALITEAMLGKKIFLRYISTSVRADVEATYSNAQIEINDTATSYEPYITPIEKELKLSGKNLLKTTDWINASINNDGTFNSSSTRLASDYILIEEGLNKLTYSLNTTALFFGIAFYDENKIYLSREVTTVNTFINATIPNSTRFARVFVQIATDITLDGNSFVEYEMQLEEGTTATPYEPYYNYTLMKDDYITEDCVIHHKRGKYIVTGNENWGDYRNEVTGLYKAYSTDIKLGRTENFELNTLYNYFKRLANMTPSLDIEGVGITKWAMYISISSSIVSSVNELKTWLSTHNIIVEYELETEETETIPNTIPLYNQVKELFNIQNSNAGTLIVETESNEENARLKVAATALQSWEVNS